MTALAAALGSAVPLSAQIGLASTPQSVQLTAVKHGAVSVSLPTGGAAAPSGLVTGPNDFTPVPVATSWNVDLERTASVTLVANFNGSAGGSLMLFTQPIAGPDAIGGRTDDLPVRIDLTTLPGLAPGTYAGTLNLVAVTQ
jgi:hypothetical protein